MNQVQISYWVRDGRYRGNRREETTKWTSAPQDALHLITRKPNWLDTYGVRIHADGDYVQHFSATAARQMARFASLKLAAGLLERMHMPVAAKEVIRLRSYLRGGDSIV